MPGWSRLRLGSALHLRYGACYRSGEYHTPAGSLTGTFTVATLPVAANQTVAIKATANSRYKSTNLTLKPIPPKLVTLSPIRSRAAILSPGPSRCSVLPDLET